MRRTDTALPVITPGAKRLETLLERRPLYLNIETTNICNARCVFCAYPKMRRPKTVMPQALFEKTIGDYVEMGGGAVSLTPIVGDVLVDPLLTDRMDTLENAREITNVSLVTNGIGWKRLPEPVRRSILVRLDAISISIGGLDDASYKTMFGVDRFRQVRAAIDDMCDLKLRHRLRVEIHLMFRVNREIDDLLTDRRMNDFRAEGVTSISAINRFANWGGMVGKQDLPPGASLVAVDTSPDAVRQAKTNPCFVFNLTPEVTATGLVTACGCMNAEARELILGDVRTEHLRDIWQGETRRQLRQAFGTDRLSNICKQCSYYADGDDFIRTPALSHFTVGDNPWEILRRHGPPPAGDVLSKVLDDLVERGCRRIALYGAGNFTRRAVCQDGLKLRDYSIVAIIDDRADLPGAQIDGVTIVSQSQAMSLEIDGVVLATDQYTADLWRISKPLREAGIPVVGIDHHALSDADVAASSA